MQAYGYIKEAYDKARTGDLADVISLPFYAQLYRGLVRNVGGLCGLGAERRELPNKFDVGRIFSDYADRDLVPTSEVQRHFEQDEETSWELAESIIEKYGAFQADPALQTLLDRQDHAQQRGEPPSPPATPPGAMPLHHADITDSFTTGTDMVAVIGAFGMIISPSAPES